MTPNYSAMRYAAAGGAVEHTHTWSRWERFKFAAAFLLIGLAAGAVLTACVNHRIPLRPDTPAQIER